MKQHINYSFQSWESRSFSVLENLCLIAIINCDGFSCMVIGKFNNKCETQFSKIPPNDVNSISTLLELGGIKQNEFLNIYLDVKSR